MVRLYAATSNPGKLRDFAVAAQHMDIRIEPLPGLKQIPAPAEDELTFAGNARLKAVYYSRFAPGEMVLADDSGLEVDALHGEPGVRSARYAEDAGFEPAEAPNTRGLMPTGRTVTGDMLSQVQTIDQRNNLYLLSRLANIPADERRARYRCVLAAACDSVCLFTSEGCVEGEILEEPRGDGGFGYDPLFYLPAFRKTMAEIDPAMKHEISHRGQALRALLQLIFP